ncbi:MAG TPA: hypothetical protein DD491_05565 [Halieaceae bacterium]|nr:hypothetical protein [Halieaceae bacterium]
MDIDKALSETKAIGLFLLGHSLHLLVTYGPPVLALYIADQSGWLNGGAIGGIVVLSMAWIFGAWWATRPWSDWGD